MLRCLISPLLAVVLTLASISIHPASDEEALYGHEGALERYYLPREVAGWPAPFLADDPGTSVPHKIGMEDVLRPGSLVATWCFWFVVVIGLRKLLKLLTSGRREVRPASE